MELLVAPVNSVTVLGSSDTEVVKTTENGINSFLEYDTDYGDGTAVFSVAVTWSSTLDLFKTSFFFFCSNLYTSREALYGSGKGFPSNLSLAGHSSLSPWIRKTRVV